MANQKARSTLAINTQIKKKVLKRNKRLCQVKFVVSSQPRSLYINASPLLFSYRLSFWESHVQFFKHMKI